jgi:drug/metabolite transporter (DMT)-like permease
LTYVLPATAMGYILIALLAKFFLHEAISHQRWIGIALITAGVGFVATGPELTHHPKHPPSQAPDSNSAKVQP